MIRKKLFTFLIFFAILGFNATRAIDVERFEHIDSRDGLSQNSVLSAYCDHIGFLWFGTMNGLNRYDGYEFKIYKAVPGKNDVLSNNRITEIWEDERGFLWLQTHDGYYHYLIRESDRFRTFPFYQQSEEERNSQMVCFTPTNRGQIWLGSSRSGVYRLNYDSLGNQYQVRQFLSRGTGSITNNHIHFVFSDAASNIWIGTEKGLNFISAADVFSENPVIRHFRIQNTFISVTETAGQIWFGTRNNGIVIFDSETGSFRTLQIPGIPENEEISQLYRTRHGEVIIGTVHHGLLAYFPRLKEFHSFYLHGKRVSGIYEDKQGTLWINTENFGINMLNIPSRTVKFFDLTPKNIQPLIDNERLKFFEDSNENLWIGTHGGGLALFDRENSRFRFFRNDPENPGTISSNFVHCIAEDKSGLLWVGTGQFNGGLNKIIPANPLFTTFIPKPDFTDRSENVVRGILQDARDNIWVATKSGAIYITDEEGKRIAMFPSIPFLDKNIPGFNIYCFLQDREGYIWLGTKGGGLAVSTRSIFDRNLKYPDIRFYSYRNVPGDSLSLSSDMIYSILQDHEGGIWIASYENGLNRVISREKEKLVCQRINSLNSRLSSDEVRYIYEDSRYRLWFGTTFGLNLLEKGTETDSFTFLTSNYDPANDKSLSYNDIIHIYEDSRQMLWFGTFGGGVNLLVKSDDGTLEFEHLNKSTGMVNDAIFGIVEDNDGNLWFSTEDGITRYHPETGLTDNFDKNNGLLFSNFSENTCLLSRSGKLFFGTTNGMVVVSPGKEKDYSYLPSVVITNFQLFNTNVVPGAEGSPLDRTIETTRKIILRHNQSSFSFEYAALSYFDPMKSQYSFMLENFDPGWNEVKFQRKATYTNLSPGEYTFMVRASNWEGKWSDHVTSVSILILPPWWATRVAYFTYFILFIILADIARRIIMRYARMRNDLKVERRVNEIKLQFFTNISHEIRTPLTLILGPLEDIRAKTKLTGNIAGSLEIMHRNGQRMLRLINQLLDFRKIQNKKMKLKITETDYPAFVSRILENFDHMARQKAIHYRHQIISEGQTAWIDTDKMDSVFFNILSNAFKFTSSGKTIEALFSEGEDYYDVIIRDEGKGIPEEKIGLLFNRYTSLSGEDNFFAGTGIGLSFSMELIKLHSGNIFVKSEAGKGSTFTVRIPKGKEHFSAEEIGDAATLNYLIHQDATEGLNSEDRTEYLDDKDKPLILIVEDNQDIVQYLEDSLKAEFRIATASDGKQGLEKSKKLNPDLIITDVMMPVMDGIKMTAEIKNSFEISHIPVVMLTARSNIEDQILGIESGAEAYVLKPFHSDYLRAVITNLLRQRELILIKYTERKEINPGKVKITNRDEEFLNFILESIEKNYSDPEFNVEKLSQTSNLSRTVFYHKIKSLTGITPVEFLKQMRLKISAQLICGSGENISEIAYRCGFNDEKYFRRCFKEFYRMTPTEYRDQQMKGSQSE